VSTITIQVPDFLRRHVERLSAQEGISVDQFYAAAASEKLSVMESGDYIAGRAARADDAAFAEVLKSIPSTQVTEAWDRMPD
jgi:hypothetical protein